METKNTTKAIYEYLKPIFESPNARSLMQEELKIFEKVDMNSSNAQQQLENICY